LDEKLHIGFLEKKLEKEALYSIALFEVNSMSTM